MKAGQIPAKNIDEYIAGFPKDVQARLQKIRSTIKKTAPGAEEKISYLMPVFTLNGKGLVAFAAFKKHISLFPAPRGVEKFKKELSRYKGGKGTVQFPLDKPIPFGLIKRIVKYRIKKNQEQAKGKKK